MSTANYVMKKYLPKSQRHGFTLIELLIVLVILGLLAALVGPQLFGQIDTAKIKTTKTQIGNFKTALNLYRLDMGKYPTTEEGLKALWEKPADSKKAAKWRGPYLEKAIENDGWENPYVYRSPGEHGEFDLISYGADGLEGGEGNDADITSWE